jgi:hypothetical protein
MSSSTWPFWNVFHLYVGSGFSRTSEGLTKEKVRLKAANYVLVKCAL